MERSAEINELAKALVKAQAALQPAIKDSDNPAYKRDGKVLRYADLTSTWDACRKPLTDNGLSVVQLPVESEPGRVALTTMLMHESGQFICETVSTRLVKDDPQGVGSGLTYLRRYGLQSVIGITSDDDDGNAASGKMPQAAQSQSPRNPLSELKTVLREARNAARERGATLPPLNVEQVNAMNDVQLRDAISQADNALASG